MPRPTEEFRHLAEAVHDSAIYQLNTNGYVVSWNAGAERIKGYGADEILGRHFSVFYTPEEVARGRPEQNLAAATAVGRIEDEGWCLRKDGTRFWAHIVLTALYGAGARHSGFATVIRDVSERLAAAKALRQSEERLHVSLEALTDPFAVLESVRDETGKIVDFVFRYANRAACAMRHLTPDQVVGKRMLDIHHLHRGLFDAYCRVVETGDPLTQEVKWQPDDPIQGTFELHAIKLGDGLVMSWRDVSERNRTEALLAGQSRILELIAKGASLAEVLTELALMVEGQDRGAVCSVLVLDDDRVRLHHVAAPSLPDGYRRALDGLAVGPTAGSCGSAVFHARPVVVTDIAADPLWVDWRDLALAEGLAACWSVPIRAERTGDILGAFCIYYRERRGPDDDALNLIYLVGHLAAIALDQARLRAQVQDIALLVDRERIARDLHDRVIQRLFAIGMMLKTAESVVIRPEVAARLEQAINDLDQTVTEIRAVVFALKDRGERGVSQRVMAMASEASTILGFEPRVHLAGQLDTVPPEVVAHLLSTLREALSNVARHARANEVDVAVQADRDLVLRVVDNGTGMVPKEGRRLGHGLRNMAARARELGGEFATSRLGPQGGTVLEWRVPVRAPAGSTDVELLGAEAAAVSGQWSSKASASPDPGTRDR